LDESIRTLGPIVEETASDFMYRRPFAEEGFAFRS
jgi:predicted HD phosphohydrolase